MIFVGTGFIPVHISRQSGGDKPRPYDSMPNGDYRKIESEVINGLPLLA